MGCIFFWAGVFLNSSKKTPEVYTVKLFYPEPSLIPLNKPAVKRPSIKKERRQKPPLKTQSKKAEKKNTVSKPVKKVKKENKKKIQERKEKKPKEKPVKKPSSKKQAKKQEKKSEAVKKANAQKRGKKVSPKVKKTKRQNIPKNKRAGHKDKAVSKVNKKSEEDVIQRRLKEIKRRVEEKKEEEYLKKRLLELQAKKKKTEKKARSHTGASKTSSPVTNRSKKGKSGEDPVLKRYFLSVWELIRSHWILPQGVIEKTDLEAVAVLVIAPSGKVLSVRFERSSGEPLFDQSVRRAIEGISSLPPLPKALADAPLELGVRFRPDYSNN